MKSKRTHDAVATIGEYTDKNGDKKKRYTRVGPGFTGPDGVISIKFDVVPVGPEWSGWVSLYEIKDQDPEPDRMPTRGGPGGW